MKVVMFLVFFFVSLLGFTQETIQASKEMLIEISVGDEKDQAAYDSNEEGFFSPKGPLVSQEGDLIFLPNTTTDKIQIFREGRFLDAPAPKTLDLAELLNRQMTSSGGLVTNNSGYQIVANKTGMFLYNYYSKSHKYLNMENNYSAPFGAIVYSEKDKTGIAIVFDVKNPKSDFSVIDQTKLKTWLPTQPGGFTIGDDGVLYRNGVLWSAIKPKDYENYDWRFVGRLISGQTIWEHGDSSGDQAFSFVNSRQEIELTLLVKLQSPYSYGVGPWGEFYYLIAPPHKPGVNLRMGADGHQNEYYSPDPSKSAELVVVRNHLKYFGRLNDGGVRLRKEPNTTSDILGTYPVKTGFRILEKGENEETIGGQKNVWYKVRLLDGKEGWFFGSFVHNLYDGPNGKAPPWPNVADW